MAGGYLMANDGPEHKLVAILAVDIVGYSGLAEIDQSGTHGQLLAHRKEVIDPAIRQIWRPHLHHRRRRISF